MESARTLVRPELFDQLSARVTKDQGVDLIRAERIVEQALLFLVACARNPSAHLTPSVSVDPGWHAFILHTRDYADFCDSIAGRFIHHQPSDGDNAAGSTLAETMAALHTTGYDVDDDLWPITAAADCADKGNCSATGEKGDENKDSRMPQCREG